MRHILSPGDKFGRLTLVVRKIIPPQSRAVWECICECGRTSVVRQDSIISGRTLSCAKSNCYRSEVSAERRTRHGLSRHPLYGLWAEMIRRCENPSAQNYKLYGGRGIAVCERWHTFSNFLEDMPLRPSLDHSIDRQNNDEGYFPENVRWKTSIEQSRNTRSAIRVIIDGNEHSFNSARKILGLTSDRKFRALMKTGLSAQESVDRVAAEKSGTFI